MSIRDVVRRLEGAAARELAPLLIDAGAAEIGVDVRAIGPRSNSTALVDALAQLDAALAEDAVTAARLAEQAITDADLERLAATSWFRRVRELDLRGNRIGARGLKALAAAPGLTSLNLGHIDLGAELGTLSGLRQLHTLRVGFTGVDGRALTALAEADLPGLRWLDLMGLGQFVSYAGFARAQDRGGLGYPVTTGAAIAPLTTSALVARLETLVVSHAALAPAACAAIGAAGWPSLRTLVLNDTQVGGHSGALIGGAFPSLEHLERAMATVDGRRQPPGGFAEAALRSAPFLSTLTGLVVPRSELSDAGAEAIVAAAGRLTQLDLSESEQGPALARALARTTAPIETLRLMTNHLDGAAVAALMSAPFVPTLRLLGLSGNPIGADGLSAVAAAPLTLTSLGLARADLDDDALVPLWRAPFLPGLARLALGGNRLSDASVPALLGVDLGTATLDLGDNAFSRGGFQRLAKAYGARVTGARRQDPGRARGTPRLVDAPALRLAPTDRAAAPAKVVKVPAKVRALGLPVEVARGSAGWFIGRVADDGGSRAILISRTGKRVEPVPPIVAPTARAPLGVVNQDHDVAVVFVSERGIFAVRLSTGASARVADAGWSATDGAAAGDRLFIQHGGSTGPQTVDLFIAERGAARHGCRLASFETRHEALALHRCGDVVVLGDRGPRAGAISFLGVRGDHLRRLGRIADGCTLVNTPLDALVQGGDARYDLTQIEAALDAAFAPAEVAPG